MVLSELKAGRSEVAGKVRQGSAQSSEFILFT